MTDDRDAVRQEMIDGLQRVREVLVDSLAKVLVAGGGDSQLEADLGHEIERTMALEATL